MRKRRPSESVVPETSALVDVEAVAAVAQALAAVSAEDRAIEVALDGIRTAFGWSYASFWRLADDRLQFGQDSGTVSAAFASVTRTATFARAVGLAGRAWAAGDLVYVPDLAELTDCVRAPAARQVGVQAGVAIPVLVEGELIGTVDFFTTERRALSDSRLAALRLVGQLLGQTVGRIRESEHAKKVATDNRAVVEILGRFAVCTDAEDAYRTALSSFAELFGWDYGSVWTVGSDELLHFAQDYGTVNAEFAAITAQATFARGVGLAGRTWQSRQLTFAEDLAEVTDCVRAPAARRAGVKSGVCLPIIVRGQVVATIDFFLTRKMILWDSRREALSRVTNLLGQTLERLEAADELRASANELSLSVNDVARSAGRVSEVAATAVNRAEASADVLASLRLASESIGSLTRVIVGIASQTNLLALNATIEAARAGDHGRGFAVVAGEVKQLAAQTESATIEVTRHVEEIQATVADVSQAVSEIGSSIGEVSELQADISAVLEQQTQIAARFRS
ncbi:MAG TPA: methyl-accepting chemotaxis protein [Jatrophihabitans sp.]|nr:methyl-accepting chemotaxis protein [Jatrophihabitans sp.]